jgi:hypothetical protein
LQHSATTNKGQTHRFALTVEPQFVKEQHHLCARIADLLLSESNRW